jgi:hypothetical protein
VGAHEIVWDVRFRRTLSAATLAVLAAGTLTACQTKVGLAASAAGHRLTDSQLASYVQAGAKPYTDQNSSTPVVPKLFALENWINLELFSAAVEHRGGAATPAELDTARTAILGGRSDSDFEKAYTKLGYTAKLADLILDQGSALVVLVERLAPGLSPQQAISALQSGQAGSLLVKAVNDKKPQVDVSPRYGTWDPSRLALSQDPNAGAPSFVHFPSTAAGGAGITQ